MSKPRLSVRDLRIAKGLSQTELCRRAGGGDQTYLSRIERAQAALLTPAFAAKLARVLRVKASDLLPEGGRR